MWHFRCKKCATKVDEQCRVCEIGRFLSDCKAAIELVSWYLYEYHHADLGHHRIIARLQSIVAQVEQSGRIDEAQRREFGEIERRVDSWLYQPT
jgi:hypothetical protein